MKKLVLSFCCIALAAAAIFFAEQGHFVGGDREGYERRAITLKGAPFEARVSDTEALRQKGLSGSSGLGAGEAMLFVFDSPEPAGFWMKDMLFPIDMVWIGDDFRVVTVAARVSPDTYPRVFYPKAPARYVVELASGTADRIGFREGDAASVSRGK